MNQRRKRRLFLLLIFLVGAAIIAALILYALRQNINFFYTPSEIIAGNAPLNHSIRVGGLVKQHSVQRDQKNLDVTFEITDLVHEIKVSYRGILPDLFKEGKGVIATGYLTQGDSFIATEILAKHDENYMPPEIRNTLKDAAHSS